MPNDIVDFINLTMKNPRILWLLVPVVILWYLRDFINDLLKHHFLDDDRE